MKISPAAAALLASALSRPAVGQECLQGGFSFEFEGQCTPDALVAAYGDVFYATGQAAGCAGGVTAEADLVAKLSAANLTLQGLCDQVYTDQEQIPFFKAANQGTDLHFEKMFYNGKGPWQEEVQTKYENEDYKPTSVLKDDAEMVRAFHDGTAQGFRVGWPGSLPNFQSSVTDSDGNPTCETGAMMCVWPKDRQANDGNGNCASPYDENCVDKDPADNTNLCYVDIERGAQSTGIEETGFLGYPEDNNDGEGAIHCHGMAWGNDVNDHTARYKANNLFYVSMYDHMYVRGYVKNIPGAPMCGCVEQMPTVSRCDCTQVDLTEKIEITFHADGTFTTNMPEVHVDFNACRGINNRNNDLYAYLGRLYYEEKITADQWGQAGRIITDSGCDSATMYHLSEKEGLVRGYDHDVDTFTMVAGRDTFFDKHIWGKMAFNRAFVEYSVSKPSNPDAAQYPVGERPIIYRICPHCKDGHKKMFYARFTPIPDDLDLVRDIVTYRSSVARPGNEYLKDFKLYPTYEDAMADTNPWKCPDRNGNGVEDGGDFNYHATFHGECSPNGARVTNQYSVWGWGHTQRDVAFYINKPDGDGIREPDTSIGAQADAMGYTSSYSGYTAHTLDYPSHEGRVLEDNNGNLYITGSGDDIWGNRDQGTFFGSEPRTGDIEVTVKVLGLTNVHHSWAKAGIMIRHEGSNARSANAHAFLSGRNGAYYGARRTEGRGSENFFHGNSLYNPHGSIFYNPAQKTAYLKMIKKMDKVDFFYSDDGVNWGHELTRTVIFPDDTFEVGLAVTSHVNGHVTEGQFAEYSVVDYAFPTSAPSISLAPTPWQPAVALGDARMGYLWDYGTSMKYRGYGSGLWGKSDSGYFHNVQRDVNSAFDATMYISYFNTGWDNARGGFMIRDSNAADAANVFLGGGGDNIGITFQSRDTAGALTVSHATQNVGNYDRAWIKLSKPEGTGPIEAFYKINANDEWISIGSTTISFTGATLQVGVAVAPSDPEERVHYVDLSVTDMEITDVGGSRKALRA